MVSDEELISRIEDSDANRDAVKYVEYAIEMDEGLGMVSSLRHFAEESGVETIERLGTDLEKEIWNNGVRRLIEDPTGEPYGANPDPSTKRVLERVYEEYYV